MSTVCPAKLSHFCLSYSSIMSPSAEFTQENLHVFELLAYVIIHELAGNTTHEAMAATCTHAQELLKAHGLHACQAAFMEAAQRSCEDWPCLTDDMPMPVIMDFCAAEFHARVFEPVALKPAEPCQVLLPNRKFNLLPIDTSPPCVAALTGSQLSPGPIAPMALPSSPSGEDPSFSEHQLSPHASGRTLRAVSVELDAQACPTATSPVV